MSQERSSDIAAVAPAVDGAPERLAAPARPPARCSFAPALVSAVIGALVFAVTLGATWVFDDVYHLFVDNRIWGPTEWPRYFTESYNDGVDNLYRPITSLSLALQAWLHGRSEEVAWVYHLVNLALYAIVCAQVAMLGARLSEVSEEHAANRSSRRELVPVALACGVLFAVHPVHTEAVASLVGRADLICAIGFLGGMLVLMRPLTPGRIAAFVALMFLSIGGKEQGLVLPGVALAWYASRRWAGLASLTTGPVPTFDAAAPAGEAKGSVLHYEPARRRGPAAPAQLGKLQLVAVALPLAAYLVVREQVLELRMVWPVNLLDPTIQTMRDVTGIDRLLMPVALAGRYVHLLTWPNWLAIDYGSAVIIPPQRWDDPYLWLGFVAMALWLAALAHALVRRWVAGLVLLAAFTLTYGVVSNIPRLIGTVFGERLIFLPSVFVVIYLVLLVGMRLRLRRAVVLPVVILLAALGALRSVAYAAQWAAPRAAFYESQAAAQPRSVRIWLLLAEELRQDAEKLRARGEHEASEAALARAADAALRAAELEPTYWDGWIVAARVAVDRGRLDEALIYAQRAVDARTDSKTTAVRGQIQQMIRARNATATQPAAKAPASRGSRQGP